MTNKEFYPLLYKFCRNMYRSIALDWSVRGYHHFKIKPHNDVVMNVEAEPDNPYDPNAFKVIKPSLDDITPHLRSASTESGHNVGRIAGRMVGRVPAELSKTFKELADNGYAHNITCKYSGRVQMVDRRRGPEIMCRYSLNVRNQVFRRTMRIFESNLTRQDLDRLRC